MSRASYLALGEKTRWPSLTPRAIAQSPRVWAITRFRVTTQLPQRYMLAASALLAAARWRARTRGTGESR
jgi:hypothetical protein